MGNKAFVDNTKPKTGTEAAFVDSAAIADTATRVEVAATLHRYVELLDF